VCGATASSAGDCPFEKTAAYRESLDFAPDLVLLMLGTNDSKPYNWKDPAAYTEDLKRLWKVYHALPNMPRIIVMTPPPAWGNPVPFDIDAKVIETEIRPAVLAGAETEGIPSIDLYAAFEGKPELLWDGVHPNGEGAEVIAQAAATWIKKEKQE
jgi:lysophospholipase L1-like esterase